jgi:hypothetical protein
MIMRNSSNKPNDGGSLNPPSIFSNGGTDASSRTFGLHWAMPSARALLVALLLTEPPWVSRPFG